MLAFLEETGANFVSLPDAFTPYFAGKVYRRALLDEVAAAIAALPEDRDDPLRPLSPRSSRRDRERFGARDL